MDSKTVMAPIKTSPYADELARAVIDFMVGKRMGLVPVLEPGGKFVGLISGNSLLRHMSPRSLSTMRKCAPVF